jgi:hypothetical protein
MSEVSLSEDSAITQPVPSAAAAVQALLTVGIAAAVLLVGRLAMLFALPQFVVNATSVLSVFLDWSVLIWVLLVAAITAWRATAPPRARAVLYVLAAAIGTLAGLVIWAVPVTVAMGAEGLSLVLPNSIVRIGGLLVAGAIGAITATVVLQPRAPLSRRVLAGAGIVALVIGWALAVSVFWASR